MNKFKLPLLAIAVALCGIFFWSCSSDDEAPKYVSCEEYAEIEAVCDAEYSSSHDDDNSFYTECVVPKVCGGASLTKCEDHYEEKCFGE